MGDVNRKNRYLSGKRRSSGVGRHGALRLWIGIYPLERGYLSYALRGRWARSIRRRLTAGDSFADRLFRPMSRAETLRYIEGNPTGFDEEDDIFYDPSL